MSRVIVLACVLGAATAATVVACTFPTISYSGSGGSSPGSTSSSATTTTSSTGSPTSTSSTSSTSSSGSTASSSSTGGSTSSATGTSTTSTGTSTTSSSSSTTSSGAPPGATCSADNTCESKVCSGGHCCTAMCHSTAAACASTGCDTIGNCVYEPIDAGCMMIPTCVDGGTTGTASHCDGMGGCVTPFLVECPGLFACADPETCKTSCGGDTDCNPGAYCASGKCTAKGAQGAHCTASDQCLTDSCNTTLGIDQCN